MTDSQSQPYAAFRLNFEQQQKRAKDLLKAAQAADPVALRRMQIAGFTDPGAFRLAQAQHCIARELRFTNWTALKRHVTQLDFARAQLGAVLDGDRRTMHIRCGHDIQRALREAGLHGTFNAHINPYLEGPVTDSADWLERRARFIAAGAGRYLGMTYEAALAGGREEERLLQEASSYPRVMLWFEHDRYDQFVLLRCLAHFHAHGAPPVLELVCINDFPGATRFVGLGQLPPEALQLLWAQRQRVSAEQLRFGYEAWRLFRADDPRPLAKLAREGTPLLPDLAPALIRHLQELPSPVDGMGLTHKLLLGIVGEREQQTAGRIVGLAMMRDPLPGLGDLSYAQILDELATLPEPLIARASAHPLPQWHLDEFAITDCGRALLDGKRNWFDCSPRERWLGGVRIAAGQRNWHWNEAARDVYANRS